MRRPSLFALILLVPVLPGADGCSAGDPCGEEGFIELRTPDGLEPLGDPETLEAERGSQGGQHVWVSVVGSGIHPGSADYTEGLRNDDLPWVEFVLEGPDGVYSNQNRLRQPLQRLPDDEVGLLERQIPFRYWSTLPDDWQEIPREEREAEMEATPFTLRVTLDDACGVHYEASTEVFLLFPDDEAGDDDDSAGALGR